MQDTHSKGVKRPLLQWTLNPRLSLAIAVVAFLATYITLFCVVEASHAGLSYTAALLGLVLLFSHVNVTFPHVGTQPTFTLQEISIVLALIGGVPAVVLPALLAIQLHRAWLSSTGRRFPIRAVFPAVVSIVLHAWGFQLIGVLGNPDRVTVETTLEAVVVLIVAATVTSLVDYRETHISTRGSVPERLLLLIMGSLCVARVAGGLIGVVAYMGTGSGLVIVLQSVGSVLLLLIALALPIVHLQHYRVWAGMQNVLTTWQLTEENVRCALANMHSLGTSHGHVLLVEDAVAGATYRAWVDPHKSKVESDVVPLPLQQAVRCGPEPEGGWSPFLSTRRTTSKVIKSGVALIQTSPRVKVSLFTQPPSTLWTGIPLAMDAMLGSLSTTVTQESESKATSAGLSQLLANIEDGFVVVDLNGTVLSWNNKIAEYTGTDACSAVGRPLTAVLDSFERAVGSVGQPLMFATGADGTKRFLYISTYTNITFANGQPANLYAFHDVSKLVASSETRNQFFAYVAHEFKGPIGALVMQVETLEDRLGEDDLDVQNLQQTIDQVTRLLGDLTTTTELGVEEIPLKMTGKAIEAHKLLEFPWMCSAVGANDRITIRQNEDFSVYADVFRARQIVTNLVSNALKYSPEGSPVLLEYGADHDTGLGYIRLVDEGIGVPDDSREALFEAYVRGRNSSNTKGQGLGLSLSRTLAQQMGGTVEYQPNHPKGSVFTLWIPLLDGSEAKDKLARQADAIA